MSGANRGVLGTALVCSVLVISGLLLLSQSRDVTPRLVWRDASEGDAPVRVRPLPLLSPADARKNRVPDQENLGGAAEDDETNDGGTFLVRGTVVREESLAPIVGARVSITSARDGDDGDPERVEVTTGDWGHLELSLEHGPWELGDLCPAGVTMAGRHVFGGVVRLLEDFVIVTRPELILRGRLVSRSTPLPVVSVAAYTPVSVAAYTPKYAATSRSIHCGGTTSMESDGWFEIAAYPEVVPEAFLLRIELDTQLDRDVSSITRSVPTAELVSDAGALIELDVARLICTVVDESGAPLAGAKVHLAGGDELDARATTDENGLASLAAPAGEVDLCVGCEGYSSATERIELPAMAEPVERVFELRRLSENDVIRGRVLVEDGSAVQGAFVSVVPAASDPEVELAGLMGTRSDAEGRFELRARTTEGLVRLRAFHRDHGFTDDDVSVFAPDGREVTLWLPKRGVAVLNLRADGFAGPFRSRPVHFVLVDRFVDAAATGFRWRSPIRIEWVKEGDYNVYVHATGLDAYGEASLHVSASGPSSVDVPVAPIRWLSGTVLRSDGSPAAGVRLRVVDENWPAEVREQLATATAGSDGSFRLFGGHRERVDVEVLEYPGERYELGRSEGNRILLPESGEKGAPAR